MHVLTGNYKSDQVHVPALLRKAGTMNCGHVLFAPLRAVAGALGRGRRRGGGGRRCALWRGLSGWALRGLTALVLLTALANPSLQTEDRTPLSDIVLLVTDRSASQKIADRDAQTTAAVTAREGEDRRPAQHRAACR